MWEENKDKGAEEDPRISLEEILKKAMDAEGYVLMLGCLTNKTNEKGDRMLEFDYRRYHMSLEDTRAAVIKFKEEYIKETQEGIGGYEI